MKSIINPISPLVYIVTLLSTITLAHSAPPANTDSPLGVNLADFSYFRSSEWMVIDQFSKASPWFAYSFANSWNAGEILETDADGWPTRLGADTVPIAMMFNNIQGHYPVGTYELFWQGSGAIPYTGSDAQNLRCHDGQPIENCPSQHARFDVPTPGNDGISIELFAPDRTAYSAQNYVRDIQVIMPGGVCGRSSTDLDYTQQCSSSRGGTGICDTGETCYDFVDVAWNRFTDPVEQINNPKVVFHPETLNQLQKFRALRFMNLQRTLESPIVSWADRAAVSQYSLALGNGMPPEYLIALANILQADPWFNMPHQADNNYITNFSQLVRDRLNPSLTAYVEYTNEHWNLNDEYPHQYMLEQAMARNIGVGQGDWERRSLFYATRASEIFDIWTSTFTNQENRLIRVLGNVMPMPHLTDLMFTVPNLSNRIDVIATAAYFGGYIGNWGTESMVQNWTLDELFNEIRYGGLSQPSEESANGAMQEIYDYIDAHFAVANQHGKPLVAYEGGQHLWGQAENNPAIQSLFTQANSDPRMGEHYDELLQYWRSAGGNEFFHHTHIEPYDMTNFGSMQYQDSDPTTSPKYAALQRYINNNPCWWTGC